MNSTRYAHKLSERHVTSTSPRACWMTEQRLAGHFKKHPEDVGQLCCMLCCATSAPVDCSIEQNCQEEECKALGDNVVASCVNSVNSNRVVASCLTFAESWIIETQKSCNCFPFWCSTCHLKIDSLSLEFPVPNPFQIIGIEPCISKVHLFNSFQMILAMGYANASASIPYLSSTTRYKSGSPGNKNAANISSSSCHVTKIYRNRARIVTW